MHKKLNRLSRWVLGAALVLTIMALGPLMHRSWIDNQASRAVLAQASSSNPFWYGAGLRSVDETFKVLLMRAHTGALDQADCATVAPGQRLTGHDSTSSGSEFAESGHMETLVAAYQDLCRGQFDAALNRLNSAAQPAFLVLQRMQLLRQLGRSAEADKLLLEVLCPAHDDWCIWSVLGNAPSAALNSTAGKDVQYAVQDFTNGAHSGEVLSAVSLTAVHNANLAVANGAPIVVTNVIPHSKGDNYIEFETQPVKDSALRFRIRGAVLGDGGKSCIVPRLVFRSDAGYLGEIAPTFEVDGKFQVDLWAKAPAQSTTVTPRITFSDACLEAGQHIAIGAAELAYAQPPK